MLSEKFLKRSSEAKWCNECEQYYEHIGGLLCVGCDVSNDELEQYMEYRENHSNLSENTEENKTPNPPESLESVEEGDLIFLSNEEVKVVEEVTSRSVKTKNKSFVKSDGTGWGSCDLDAAPYSNEDVEYNLDQIEVGSKVEISNGDTEVVEKVSTRQIRTKNYKFKKSDGTGWSNQKADLILKG